MGDQLYADVWAPLPHTLPRGPRAEVRALLGRRRLPRAARRVPDARQLRRPRVLERLPAAADPGPAQLGPLPARTPGTRSPRSTTPTRARSTRRASAGRRSSVPPVELLHRRHALAPHPRRRPARAADGARSSGTTSRRGRATSQGPGVLVLPQPLLKAGGSKTDRTLRGLQGVRPLRRDLRARARRARAARHPDPDRRHPHRPALAAPRSSACSGQIHELVAIPAAWSRRTCRRGATSPPSCRTS